MPQPSLLSVLALTTLPVKLLIAGKVDCLLAPDQALALVLRWPARYTWDGSKTRVRKLIDTDPQPNAWLPRRDDRSWRSSQAAVCPPDAGYYESRRSGKINA